MEPPRSPVSHLGLHSFWARLHLHLHPRRHCRVTGNVENTAGLSGHVEFETGLSGLLGPDFRGAVSISEPQLPPL